jgi:hypothetical protein
MDLTVDEPGDLESLIPVWGSGKASVHHFQQGNWKTGVVYAGLAASDFFFVKALGQIGGRLLFRSGMSLMKKKSGSLMVKSSVEGLERAGGVTANEAISLAKEASKSTAWANSGTRNVLGKNISFGPGAELLEMNGWFAKRINPNANVFKRAWGLLSIEAQEQGLARLGADLSTDFFVKDGMLFTRNVGEILTKRSGNGYLKNLARGSWKLRTGLNDIRPGNMGLNGKIFDPALDPVQKAFIWKGVGKVGRKFEDSRSAK